MGSIKFAQPTLKTEDPRRIKPEAKRVEPFYLTPEWQRLMATIISKRGRICQDPKHDPRRPSGGMRVFGDHIVELKDGGAALDEANILLRCGSCHTRKTMRQRAIRAGIAGPTL